MKRNIWFRIYSDAVDDPKVQRLHPTLFKVWFNLLCLASKNDGRLPSNDDIAFRLRLSTFEAEGYMDELILAGLIDILPDGQRTPHNWETRQFVSGSVSGNATTSTERVRKHRKIKRETLCNVSETPPDPDPETDTEEKTLTSTVVRASSGSKRNSNFLGQGQGGSVSVDAKRKACAALAIGNADPLVAVYEAWRGSRTARDPDALFLKTAPGFYRDAAPNVKRACLPIADAPPDPLPPVKVSSQLIASLSKGKRHGVRAV